MLFSSGQNRLFIFCCVDRDWYSRSQGFKLPLRWRLKYHPGLIGASFYFQSLVCVHVSAEIRRDLGFIFMFSLNVSLF